MPANAPSAGVTLFGVDSAGNDVALNAGGLGELVVGNDYVHDAFTNAAFTDAETYTSEFSVPGFEKVVLSVNSDQNFAVYIDWYDDESFSNVVSTQELKTGSSGEFATSELIASPYFKVRILDETSDTNDASLSGTIYAR